MVEAHLAADIGEVLDVDASAFQAAVEAEAQTLRAEVAEGTFDNPEGLVGLEYEFYAVRGADPGTAEEPAMGALCRIPRRTLSFMGFEKELGLHNAEMGTMPQPLNRYGLAAQASEVRARMAAARTAIAPHDLRLVSDGIWTIPPVGETATSYLTDSVEIDGVRIAANMSEALRYHAMANTDVEANMRVEAPHVSLQADTIMPESLTTSIQPHYQVPYATELASYFRYAVRLAGPLLALGVNAPLFPADLYDDGVDPYAVLDDAHHESRIAVFESAMNADDVRKVRFPRDIADVDEAIDRIVQDHTFVPMPVEERGRFDDRFAHFRHKHGTYWRWVRPVFEGATASQANARIEFRPLPGQPTVADTVAFQAAFAGALEGMYAGSHPVAELPWETARENFYAAMRDGVDADLEWITADDVYTTDAAAIYDDLFAAAEAGLQATLGPSVDVQSYLGPVRHRVEAGGSPAAWKLAVARGHLDAGVDLADAIAATQRAYLREQRRTLLEGTFGDWPAPEAAVASTPPSA